MRNRFDTLIILAQIALRNLMASGWKSSIVGGVIGFGVFLVVVGTSLLDGIDNAMRGSITGSVTGNIQVYSSDSRDELDVMGSLSTDTPELAPVADFAKLKSVLGSVPNIKAVVPMGISNAVVITGNSVDSALAELRELATKRAAGDPSPDIERRYVAQKGLVNHVIDVVGADFGKAHGIDSERAVSRDDIALVKRVTSPDYWSAFDADAFAQLELLENRVAPLMPDSDFLLLRYAGTDPDAFADAFKRMHIVEGQSIPRGQRGFLLSTYVYETEFKLKSAHGLDALKQARDLRGAKIADDPDLQRIVREDVVGVREILLQLDALTSARVCKKLRAYLHSDAQDPRALLAQFFETTDANLDERHHFFYAALAPELKLHRIGIGDSLTIKAVTRGGYVKSTRVKIYGTFSFAGLEQSPQAGSLNLMDLVTFRELYGFTTLEAERELQELRKAGGMREIARGEAEAELFGARVPVQEVASVAAPPPQALDAQGAAGTGERSRTASDDRFDPAELERGPVLNAAVLVQDEHLIDQTMRAIERAVKRNGLPLRVVSWQKASGVLGQFTVVMTVLLYTAVLIIFIVGVVIVNNSLIMAMLERVGEIGMLRAIGAQPSFVLAIMLLESLLVALVAATVGAALGVALVLVLGKTGIPASSDLVTFFFSGPRLYPKLQSVQLSFGVLAVLFVSVASGLYPAWLAMRVSPREAMQPGE